MRMRALLPRFSIALMVACDRDGGDRGLDANNEEELLEMELVANDLPPSSTNAHADDPSAAALGQRLFFDPRLSRTGEVACASCHDPEEGFSDPRSRSLGVEGQTGARHAMPITAAAMQTFFLWDGGADSLWLQPLMALENPKEMDFTRNEVAHFIAENYRTDYEAVFGQLPDLSALPARAKPDSSEWQSMSEEQKDVAQRIFTNVGKSIEAYERKLLCTDTRFDQWVRGELELTDEESNGAAAFMREGCVRCHSGKAFSDGEFHNLGLSENAQDVGRERAIPSLLANPLNGAGSYSDDPAAGAAKLAGMTTETGTRGAFRTASLRGAGQRRFFGHTGEHETLEGFIRATYRRGGRGNGNDGNDGDQGDGAQVGQLDPLLDGVNVGRNVDDLVAFIRTLDCPSPPNSLLDP